MAVWYFGKPDIPFSGLVLSFSALAVPLIATFLFPESAREYEVLLWLLALVPAFLLAFYRGWVGVALAMLIGMVVLAVAQIAVLLLALPTNWVLVAAVVVAYIAVGLGLGFVSEMLHQERARAERLALIDDLTGAPNRRLADLFLDKGVAAAHRGRPLILILFDIDGFKAYNDRHGHAAGDAALCHFVRILQRHTRQMDLCARYGGEEFVAILSGAPVEAGIGFAARVRASLAALADAPTEPGAARLEPFTVSAGVAAFEPGMPDAAALMAAADTALYAAKREGRDQVRVHPVATALPA
jgi:diguanylate cyclase (GGDEF)-like protein